MTVSRCGRQAASVATADRTYEYSVGFEMPSIVQILAIGIAFSL